LPYIGRRDADIGVGRLQPLVGQQRNLHRLVGRDGFAMDQPVDAGRGGFCCLVRLYPHALLADDILAGRGHRFESMLRIR
jgi:hypothetical protein